MAETFVARPYAGIADLRRMQSVVAARFGHGIDHAGDLGWAVRNQTHLEASTLLTLVESRGGELLGWAWCHGNGWFDAVNAVDDGASVYELLVRIALDTVARLRTYGDGVENISTLCVEDDDAFAAALQRHGFAPIKTTYEVTCRSLDDLPQPALPEGFTFSGVDDSLVDARVEVHRAAFAPSILTIAGFRRVRRTWPYRADLDRVVLAPDGTVAAACLAWYDDTIGWGLLEPVGTRPEFQRRGLGAAVCLDALHHLRSAGAHSVQVGCETDSAGCATYHSIGFTTVRRVFIFRRTL
jgi:ribosomal protein S18 acetylase RimI-like enzyme